ncbi:methyltransferase domain-containing protein [soil metagenome]
MKTVAPTQGASGAAAVRGHYDELDRFYREVWGEHVHHGLWLTGRESPEEAVRQLSRRVADHAGIGAGSRVCDVGSGYGATARLLARERGARVTAITLSSAQHDYAVSVDPDAANPRYRLGDWLRNDLPEQSFDAVIAIESSEHMADKAGFFAEARRVLRPGGRLAVCAWLARRSATRLERRFLLEPISHEGRMPALETRERYRAFFREAGFRLEADEDLTRRVARTWTICLRRVAAGVLRPAHFRRYLLENRGSERVFLLTMLRIRLAYRLGSMRYGLVAGVRE